MSGPHATTVMLSTTLLPFVSLLSTTAAHFLLDYPIVRGFDEDILGTFPCGGQSKVSPSKSPAAINQW
jgi:hypothetical protein